MFFFTPTLRYTLQQHMLDLLTAIKQPQTREKANWNCDFRLVDLFTQRSLASSLLCQHVGRTFIKEEIVWLKNACALIRAWSESDQTLVRPIRLSLHKERKEVWKLFMISLTSPQLTEYLYASYRRRLFFQIYSWQEAKNRTTQYTQLSFHMHTLIFLPYLNIT